VRLFTERARAVSQSFGLTQENVQDVVTLCFHLDGMPLAIELAASRVALFPVTTILERLNDRFRLLVGGSRTALSRQQTLQATLDWSYNLLDEEERTLLRSLSLFVGGIALDAAEGICGGEDGVHNVLGLLGQLVEKSLVALDEAGGEPRYRLLETVRAYGLEQIGESAEREAVEARHAEWFLELATRAEEALPRPDRTAWLARLDVEHDNIRAALDRSLLSHPERALRIAGSMWHFWLWRAHLAEGRRWLDLALARAPGRSALQGTALLGSAVLTVRSGRPQEGIALAEQSLEIYRDLGDKRSSCRVLHTIAPSAWSLDDAAGAERVYRESLALAEEADFGPGRAAAMEGLGIIRWSRGHRQEAEALLQESLALFRSLVDSPELAPTALQVGEFLVPEPETAGVRLVFEEAFSMFQDVPCRAAVGYVLSNLGMIARVEGDHKAARSYMEEALSVFETMADERAIGHTLGRLGNLATAEGDYERARELLERSLEVRRGIRDWLGVTLSESNLGNLAIAEGDYERAGTLLERSADAFRRRGNRWGFSTTLGNLASLALARGDRTEARRRLEESLSVIREIGRTRWIGWALVQLAALARLEGDHDQAENHIEEALAIFRRIDDPRGIEHCLAFRSGSPHRVLATVLFADIVESTQKAVEIGDQRWRALLESFHELVGTKLTDFGGRHVDTAGDGFLAVFESPVRGITCALSIARGSRRLGVEIRAGVHTGELERVGDAVRGIAVHIGARVAAEADPGEVLVTRTVRDLVMGSGIELEDRGERALKGVPGEWSLFAVREAPKTA
jgi:class 3 adenylate cyclase